MGRPPSYTEELGTEICRLISEGRSLRSICREEGMPVLSTVLLWVVDGKHQKFSEQYAKACDTRSEVLFEELLEIADESSKAIVGDDKSDNARIQAEKLRVDTRKWFLSKMKPKKFGDKLDLTSDGKRLPTPLLANVRNNDRNKKDSGAH